MNTNKHDIDRFFKNSIENHIETVPKEVWRNMEKYLKGKANPYDENISISNVKEGSSKDSTNLTHNTADHKLYKRFSKKPVKLFVKLLERWLFPLAKNR